MRNFISDRWGPLRDGLFSYAQIAMLGGVLIAGLIATGSDVATDGPNVVALGLITMLVSVLALLVPWHRLPRISLISVAIVDVLIVAVLRTELVITQPTLDILVLIPALWLAYSFGLVGVIVAGLSDYLVALFPNWLSGYWPRTPAEWGVDTIVPAIVSAVGIAVYIAARHIQKQRVALTLAYDELTKAVGSRDEFLRTISHELRTPLTSMIGYLEVIEDSLDLEQDTIVESFGIIQRNSQRLLSLINSLITEAWGRPSPKRRSENLSALANRALDAARPSAAKAGVHFTEVQLQAVRAEVDAAEIAEVLGELLSNAVKFTQRGGSVLLGITQDDTEVVVSVTDTGIGIPADELPHIFERFFRGSAAGRAAVAGTGLGLATAKAIVEAHGGQIRATNREPHGITIELRLPLMMRRSAELQPA